MSENTAPGPLTLVSPRSPEEVKRRFLREMRAGGDLGSYSLRLKLTEFKLNQYEFFEGIEPFGTPLHNLRNTEEVVLSVTCPPDGAPLVFFIGYDDVRAGLYPETGKE